MIEHLHDEEPHEYRRSVADRFERRIQMSVPERHNEKLRALVESEIGEDRPPFGLDLFGTREIRYARDAG